MDGRTQLNLEIITNNCKYFHAYFCQSDEVQSGIRDMIQIILSDYSTDDEKIMAMNTFVEALEV